MVHNQVWVGTDKIQIAVLYLCQKRNIFRWRISGIYGRRTQDKICFAFVAFYQRQILKRHTRTIRAQVPHRFSKVARANTRTRGIPRGQDIVISLAGNT